MNDSFVVVLVATAVVYGTPLLYAALGELLAERSGVLNLGVEGMMLMGAVMGFWAVQRFDGPNAAVLAAALGVAAAAGAAMALIHAFLVITLRANQIVSGLALTIFAGAAGLASYLGNDLGLTGAPAEHTFKPLDLFGLGDLPVVGPILFDQNALVYLSWLAVAGIGVYLARTRPGLNVRAVGEAPASADAMGINVTAYRYAHTLVGGAFAGVAGACFSLAIIGQWQTTLTGGAGWIAIALVIFAFWRPDLCLVGRLLLRRVLGAAAHPSRPRLAHGHPVGSVLVAAVRDDHRRARARVHALCEEATRRAGSPRSARTCARSARTSGWRC